MSERVTWQDIIARNPQGFIQVHFKGFAYEGPIVGIGIEEDGDNGEVVDVTCKWIAKARLTGIPLAPVGWTLTADHHIKFSAQMRVAIQEASERGPVARFAVTSFLYLDDVKGVDPSEIRGFEEG